VKPKRIDQIEAKDYGVNVIKDAVVDGVGAGNLVIYGEGLSGRILCFWDVHLNDVGMSSHALVSIIMALLWIVGVALPAKEILSKPS
jgi:hypothetical protein